MLRPLRRSPLLLIVALQQLFLLVVAKVHILHHSAIVAQFLDRRPGLCCNYGPQFLEPRDLPRDLTQVSFVDVMLPPSITHATVLARVVEVGFRRVRGQRGRRSVRKVF